MAPLRASIARSERSPVPPSNAQLLHEHDHRLDPHTCGVALHPPPSVSTLITRCECVTMDVICTPTTRSLTHSLTVSLTHSLERTLSFGHAALSVGPPVGNGGQPARMRKTSPGRGESHQYERARTHTHKRARTHARTHVQTHPHAHTRTHTHKQHGMHLLKHALHDAITLWRGV